MAVKYSKVRDFGAKGRKTRKIGKHFFTKKSIHKTKSNARIKAGQWRKKGYLARVEKLPFGMGYEVLAKRK